MASDMTVLKPQNWSRLKPYYTNLKGRGGRSPSPQSEEVPQSKNAGNAENADTKMCRMRSMRLTGFNEIGFTVALCDPHYFGPEARNLFSSRRSGSRKFPYAVVLNAVRRRNTQMSAKERKRKSAKERKRALLRKI